MYQISDEVIKNENENKRRLGIFGICLRNCYKGLCIAVWNWYLFFYGNRNRFNGWTIWWEDIGEYDWWNLEFYCWLARRIISLYDHINIF